MNIQEASIATGISKDMIRFYEKGLIHPHRNPENNYRDYNISDIHILVTIKFYSSLGITISDIGTILKDGNIPLAIESLNNQLEHLEAAFWARTKYMLASDTYHLLQKYIHGIDYDIGINPIQYYYPSANFKKSKTSIITNKIPVSRLVFRIQEKNKNKHDYSQDTGLLLTKQNKNINGKYQVIEKHKFYRIIKEVKINQLISVSELKKLEKRIQKQGYKTYGDIYIYSIFHNVPDITSETICIEFMIY